MVSTQEQETLQLRALKLQTPIKDLIMDTFPLSSFTLRALHRREGAHRHRSLILRIEVVES